MPTNPIYRDAAQTSTATLVAGSRDASEVVPGDAGAWIAVWQLALTAAAVLAVDPKRLHGVVIRSRAGPVRDRWLHEFAQMLPPDVVVKRVPSNIADGRLLGGLDLASTLATGRPVAERGVLADCDGGVVVFPMAERMSSYTAAKLASVIDTGVVVVERDGFQLRHDTSFAVVLLDEGIEDDEFASSAIADRVAFQIDLSDFPERLLRHQFESGMSAASEEIFAVTAEDVNAARALLRDVIARDDAISALTSTAYALGVEGMRAPNLAVNVARAIAALNGRRVASDEDVQLAGRLVLAPRATRLPSPPPAEENESSEPDEAPPEDLSPPDQPPENEDSPDDADEPEDHEINIDQPLEDVVLAATAASIPEKLLLKLMMQANASRGASKSSGPSGQARHSTKRGRVVGTVRGDIRSGARMNVLATLRAAAPWQRFRAQAIANSPSAAERTGRLHIRKEDFRVNRYQERGETTTVFVVDASGSSALNRLAEAKGAVELLLADCYIRRDRVSVIAFRGKAAEVLLPATRSLVRAKRSLAGLPGGGGTPLANGIDAAREMAEGLSRRGDTVVVVMLTDGKANVARNGIGGNRPLAEADALSAARSLRTIPGLRSLFVDTSPMANPRAEALAVAMGATYLPLPHAGARTLMNAVQVAGSLSKAATR